MTLVTTAPSWVKTKSTLSTSAMQVITVLRVRLGQSRPTLLEALAAQLVDTVKQEQQRRLTVSRASMGRTREPAMRMNVSTVNLASIASVKTPQTPLVLARRAIIVTEARSLTTQTPLLVSIPMQVLPSRVTTLLKALSSRLNAPRVNLRETRVVKPVTVAVLVSSVMA